MPTRTTTKSVRIPPSWDVQIEKLLQANRPERDKSDFLNTALVEHIVNWLQGLPQFPKELTELLSALLSIASAEDDNRKYTDTVQTFRRLEWLTNQLSGDPELVTQLLRQVKTLIASAPGGSLHAGTRLIKESLPEDSGGISLRPSDAVETVEAPEKKAKGQHIDPDSFDQPVQDTHGHTSLLSGRIWTLMDVLIDRLIASHAFPYDTSSDLMRHALARHIVTLQTVPPPLSEEGQITAILRVLWEWEVRVDADARFFSLLKDAVDYYTKQGDADMLYEHCLNAKSRIDSLPDSLWKKRQVRQFQIGFAHFLAGRGIDLNPNHS